MKTIIALQKLTMRIEDDGKEEEGEEGGEDDDTGGDNGHFDNNADDVINRSNCSHIEFEDSEEEAGDTVVTGGLKLGHKGGDQVGGQVRPGQAKMPTDGLTSSISRFDSISK